MHQRGRLLSELATPLSDFYRGPSKYLADPEQSLKHTTSTLFSNQGLHTTRKSGQVSSMLW